MQRRLPVVVADIKRQTIDCKDSNIRKSFSSGSSGVQAPLADEIQLVKGLPRLRIRKKLPLQLQTIAPIRDALPHTHLYLWHSGLLRDKILFGREELLSGQVVLHDAQLVGCNAVSMHLPNTPTHRSFLR